jgi:hypothetical protein
MSFIYSLPQIALTAQAEALDAAHGQRPTSGINYPDLTLLGSEQSSLAPIQTSQARK